MEAHSLVIDEIDLDPVVPELILKPIELEDEKEKNRLSRFPKHVGALWSEALLDYRESDSKAAFIGRTAMAATTQVIERSQLGVVAVPFATLEVLQQTNSAIAAGLVAGSMNYTWNTIVGESLTEGLNKVPKAVAKYREHFLRSTEVVYDTLPRDHTHETVPGQKPSTARKIGQTILYHTLNSAAATLRGMTSYVATTSVMKDRSKSEIKKFYRTAARDGAIAVALLTGGVSEIITTIGTSNPEIASKIEFYGSNKFVAYGVMAAFAIGEFVMNRRRKRKLNLSKDTADLSVIN